MSARLGWGASLVVCVVAVPLAAAEGPKDTVPFEVSCSVKLPEGWSVNPAFAQGRSVQLLRNRHQANGDVLDASVVVASEPRRNHQEAVHRLVEIAGEQRDAFTLVEVGGWPALRRERVGPAPQSEHGGHLAAQLLKTLTFAVATEAQLVRAEASSSSQTDPSLSNELEEIGQSLRCAGQSIPAQTHRELELLKKEARPAPRAPRSSLPRPRPGSAIGKPRIGGAHGGEPELGTAAAVANGWGELEVAVMSTPLGDNVVVAGNSGIFYSANGGVTFAPSALAGTGFAAFSDLSTAVGPGNRVYVSSTGGCSLPVAKSTDLGQNFTVLGSARSCNTGCSVDQEHIAADPLNPAPGLGDQVYLAFRSYTGSGPCGNFTGPVPEAASIMCSVNGGTSWSKVTTVDGSGDLPRLTVGKDGSVYVVYQSGGNLMLSKFSSCASGLTQQTGFPVTVAAVNWVACPVPGLDRCDSGNNLSSYMAAVDQTDPNHVFVAVAANTAPNNEDIMVLDSTDGAATFSRAVRVNNGVSARRFMPWVCTIGKTAHVTWYDRRAAKPTADDLTEFFRGSASVSGGALVAGPEVDVSLTPDSECDAGWPAPPVTTADATSCSTPQLAGRCLTPAPAGSPPGTGPTGSNAPCNYAGPPCTVSTEVCLTNGGVPKYGDYNGTACSADHVYAAWASATPPKGVAAPVGGPGVSVSLYIDARCGALAEPCCKGGTCNSASLACDEKQICTHCGEPGQLCCAGDTCSPRGFCAPTPGRSKKTCQCGGFTQPCCEGKSCNSPLLTCSPKGECVSACGHLGEPCCHSSPDAAPPTHAGSLAGWCYAAACSADVCVCGGKDQPCCPGDRCNTGLSCASGAKVCVDSSLAAKCTKCSTDLKKCVKGCATDPAHQALCECLCRNTACDCISGNSCGTCVPETCTGP